MSVQALDVISVNIWQILVSLANLLILMGIVKKFLFKPMQAMLAKRKEQVDSVYSEAEETRRAAYADKAEYAQRLSGARREADDILRIAQERANRAGDGIVAEANAKAASLLRKADEDITLERKKAEDELLKQVSGLSVDIAEKVLGREINERDQRDLIDKFIESVGDTQ